MRLKILTVRVGAIKIEHSQCIFNAVGRSACSWPALFQRNTSLHNTRHEYSLDTPIALCVASAGQQDAKHRRLQRLVMCFTPRTDPTRTHPPQLRTTEACPAIPVAASSSSTSSGPQKIDGSSVETARSEASQLSSDDSTTCSLSNSSVILQAFVCCNGSDSCSSFWDKNGLHRMVLCNV